MKKRKKTTRPRKAAKARGRKPRVSAIRTGFRAVTAYLTVRGAADALALYKRAFGARELMRMPGPAGTLMHAEMKIGDSVVFLGDEFPDMGPGPRAPQTLGGVSGSLHLYVPNVDRAVERAVAAGCEVRMPAADMFWGDRFARVADPFGHEWGLATHKEDVKPAEMRKRAAAFMAHMGQP